MRTGGGGQNAAVLQENVDLGFASSVAGHRARKPAANALWIAERHAGKYNKTICLAFKPLLPIPSR